MAEERDRLAGRRVLVVEDEALVAMLLEDILLDLGAAVMGPAGRVSEALGLLADGASDPPPDAAILDVNLGGESSAPVAAELDRLGVPYAFATGYGADGAPPGFEGRPVLPKPFQEGDLVAVMAQVLA